WTTMGQSAAIPDTCAVSCSPPIAATPGGQLHQELCYGRRCVVRSISRRTRSDVIHRHFRQRQFDEAHSAPCFNSRDFSAFSNGSTTLSVAILEFVVRFAASSVVRNSSGDTGLCVTRLCVVMLSIGGTRLHV